MWVILRTVGENMKISQRPRRTTLSPWRVIIASLLPLWLVSIAIMAEGFPRPPISPEVAVVTFVIAGAVSLLLMWQGELTLELLAYSLFPFILPSIFDEISTAYKTPFIILCAIILTAGVFVYHRSYATRLGRGLMLLAIAGAVFVMAWHAALNFWEMASSLGYVRCFPDAHGCAPLTGHATPWWILFFRP